MNRIAPFFLILTVLAGVSFAAPVSNTLVVSIQADREFIEEHELYLDSLERLSAEKRGLETRVIAHTAAITSLSVKIRRGLVRYKPGLDSTLPASLTDTHYVKGTDSGTTDTIFWNDEAETQRAK